MAVNVNIDLNVKQAQIKAQKLELQLEKVNEKIERQEDKIKQLNKELEEHNKLLQKAKESGQDISKDKWATELKRQIAEATTELKILKNTADSLSLKMKTLSQPMPTSIFKQEEFKNLTKLAENAGKAIKNKMTSLIPDFNKVGSAISGVGSKILKLASYTFVFSVITKGFRAIRSACVDYINTNAELQNSLARVKGNLITAFQPIWEFILPYLIKFTQWLANATAYVSAFLSALFGKTEQSSRNNARALHTQIAMSKQSSNALKKQKKNTDALTKANEKNARSLAKFDELLLMDKNKDKTPKSSSPDSSTGITEPTGISFETPKIDLSGVSQLAEQIQNFFLPLQEPFDRLLNSLERLKGYTFEAFSDFYNSFLKPISEYVVQTFLPDLLNAIADSLDRMHFETVNEGLRQLWEQLEPFAENVLGGIKWFITDFLLPISEWTVNDALPAFLKTITNALKVLNSLINVLKPSIKKFYNEIVKPLGEYLGDKFTKTLEKVNELLEDANKFLEDNKEDIQRVSDVITNVLGFALKGLMFTWDLTFSGTLASFTSFKDTVLFFAELILKALSGLIYFLSGDFAGGWDNAFSMIKKTTINILNSIVGVFDYAIRLFNQGVNSFLKPVLDTIGKLTGKSISIQLPTGNLGRIPQLASGAVIPPNSPFLAMLGEQKSGVNIETPLETMKQAFKEALAENGTLNNNGSYTFIAQLDGRTIFEETVFQNDMYINQTGRSAFAY